MECGLLGRKLGHSYSPQIHAYLGDYRYTLFEKEPEEVEDFLKNGDFSAINVTIPYKKTVMPYCTLTPTAKYMSSVNTIIRQPDGTLLGHNTDYFGFKSMLARNHFDPRGKKCLVLGSGGASVTAVAVLKELGGQVVVISRSGENHYGNLHLHADAAIICNTTPVGMYPNTGVSPVDLTLFPKVAAVVDMIYNPARTELLIQAEKLGIPHCCGLWMLVAQAKEAAEYFLGKPLPEELLESVYRRMRLQMENLILVGMPGCGKTTIGQQLAKTLGKTFVDADVLLEETFGTTIAEIFSTEGEAGFREKETQILSRLGKQSGLVIATGGGCVTRERNYPLLHQNGTIFWLQRELQKLPKDGRPLSQRGDLSAMYAARKPLYEAFSDRIVSNDGDVDQTTADVIAIWEECT